jgi:hypothetical protein
MHESFQGYPVQPAYPCRPDNGRVPVLAPRSIRAHPHKMIGSPLTLTSSPAVSLEKPPIAELTMPNRRPLFKNGFALISCRNLSSLCPFLERLVRNREPPKLVHNVLPLTGPSITALEVLSNIGNGPKAPATMSENSPGNVRKVYRVVKGGVG